jgi:hypothetical protein
MAEQAPKFDLKKFERFLGQWIISLYRKLIGATLEKEFQTELQNREMINTVFSEDEKKYYMDKIVDYKQVLTKSVWLRNQMQGKKYSLIAETLVNYFNGEVGRNSLEIISKDYKSTILGLKDTINQVLIYTDVAKKLVYSRSDKHECVGSIISLAQGKRRFMIEQITDMINWLQTDQTSDFYQNYDFIYASLKGMQSILIDDYDVNEVFYNLEINGIGPVEFSEFIDNEFLKLDAEYCKYKAERDDYLQSELD